MHFFSISIFNNLFDSTRIASEILNLSVNEYYKSVMRTARIPYIIIKHENITFVYHHNVTSKLTSIISCTENSQNITI